MFTLETLERPTDNDVPQHIISVIDEVLEVNSLKLCGKSVHDICSTLCQMSGTLTFVVIPASSPVSSCPEEEEASHPVVSCYNQRSFVSSRRCKS